MHNCDAVHDQETISTADAWALFSDSSLSYIVEQCLAYMVKQWVQQIVKSSEVKGFLH